MTCRYQVHSCRNRKARFLEVRQSADVVRHQAPSVEEERCLFFLCGDQCEKFLKVLVGMKDVLPVVSASDDMIEPTALLLPEEEWTRILFIGDEVEGPSKRGFGAMVDECSRTFQGNRTSAPCCDRVS